MKIGVLLASGVGRRICEDLEISNKCLMKVNDKTFIMNTVEQLLEVAERVYISVGHNAYNVVEALQDIAPDRIFFTYVEEYATTNNVVSMQQILKSIRQTGVDEITRMFYAESDVYYNPDHNIFDKLDKIAENRNARCTVESEQGKSEWYVTEYSDESRTIIKNYEASDKGGISIIGAAVYNNDFMKSYERMIDIVAEEDNQTYCDEAEKRLLQSFDIHQMFLKNDSIIEIDTLQEYEDARSSGLALSV